MSWITKVWRRRREESPAATIAAGESAAYERGLVRGRDELMRRVNMTLEPMGVGVALVDGEVQMAVRHEQFEKWQKEQDYIETKMIVDESRRRRDMEAEAGDFVAKQAQPQEDLEAAIIPDPKRYVTKETMGEALELARKSEFKKGSDYGHGVAVFEANRLLLKYGIRLESNQTAHMIMHAEADDLEPLTAQRGQAFSDGYKFGIWRVNSLLRLTPIRFGFSYMGTLVRHIDYGRVPPKVRLAWLTQDVRKELDRGDGYIEDRAHSIVEWAEESLKALKEADPISGEDAERKLALILGEETPKAIEAGVESNHNEASDE